MSFPSLRRSSARATDSRVAVRAADGGTRSDDLPERLFAVGHRSGTWTDARGRKQVRNAETTGGVLEGEEVVCVRAHAGSVPGSGVTEVDVEDHRAILTKDIRRHAVPPKPGSTDRSMTGRDAGRAESSAGVAAFARRCRGRAGARSRRSAQLGGAEGAVARVREACAGMLARASGPGRRCERASGRER